LLFAVIIVALIVCSFVIKTSENPIPESPQTEDAAISMPEPPPSATSPDAPPQEEPSPQTETSEDIPMLPPEPEDYGSGI
jgi:hypothetical protein